LDDVTLEEGKSNNYTKEELLRGKAKLLVNEFTVEEYKDYAVSITGDNFADFFDPYDT